MRGFLLPRIADVNCIGMVEGCPIDVLRVVRQMATHRFRKI